MTPPKMYAFSKEMSRQAKEIEIFIILNQEVLSLFRVGQSAVSRHVRMEEHKV